MNIYVSNLSFKLQDEDLKQVFTAFGEVTSAKVIRDNQSGRSRGFGFVEMSSDDDARAAIEKLNGTEVDGRTIVVNEARPRRRRRRRWIQETWRQWRLRRWWRWRLRKEARLQQRQRLILPLPDSR